MMARGDEERAALVALLRTRPGSRTWSALTSEVAESGSALEVWRRRVDQTPSLFDSPDIDPLQVARDDLGKWCDSGLAVLTMLDQEYPAQLREVHEMPPLLFAYGTLV